MRSVLYRVLQRTLHSGRLEMVDAEGVVHEFGDGHGKRVRMRFTSHAAEWAVFLDPEMGLGEEYVSGGYVLEEGTVFDLLTLLAGNVGEGGKTWWTFAFGGVRTLIRYLFGDRNNTGRARSNVHHHYDLDGRLYQLFLDKDLQYSCAYYGPGIDNLEDAQLAKKRHIAAKLQLEPGMRVLDIGSGWGGLGLYLAEHTGVNVVGVTLSDEQFAVSNKRAAERGLSDRVQFLLEDYRELTGPFDRIVSVGMFEHVGRKHYREFFRHVDQLLAPNGVALVHTIAKYRIRGPVSAWVEKYIFPGSYVPTLSELAPIIEDQGFWLTDLEILRLHYAETLRAWNERFQARREQAAAIYDERFCRMWEFYLQLCEVGFRSMTLCNFQLQLTKKIGTLPITRDYMFEAESDLRSAERSPERVPLRLAGE